MSILDSIMSRLGSNPEFLAWLRGANSGRGVPTWTGANNTGKLGGYPGWEPGMPRAPGNSPMPNRPGGLGGTYTPSGGQMVPTGTPTPLDAARAQGVGSLAPARPSFMGSMGPGGGGAPPSGGGLPSAPGTPGTPVPYRPPGLPTSPAGPIPGNGPINGQFSPAPGPLPPSTTPRLPPPSAPSAGLGWGGPAAAAGLAGMVGGSGGPAPPNGPNPSPFFPQGDLGPSAGGYGAVPFVQGNSKPFDLPSPVGDRGGQTRWFSTEYPVAGRRGPSVPMPRPRPKTPPTTQSAPAPQAAPQGYIDPGSFNGLGINRNGSGSAQPSLQELLARLRSQGGLQFGQ